MEDNKTQNLTRLQHLHFIHHGDGLHNMFLLKSCLKKSSWHLHFRVFILRMVNHDVVKSSWTSGPECVYITTLGAEIKLNFNKKSMCLYNVHDRKKKTREGFPARWCVWIWQGACWMQERAIVTAGVPDLYNTSVVISDIWYLFVWDPVLPSATPGHLRSSSNGCRTAAPLVK